MRKFIDIIEAAQGKQLRWGSEHLYHVTPSANLNNILENGLLPSKSRGTNAVYLASDEDHALGYVGHHDGDYDVVLLAIKWDDLDPNLFGPDDADLPDMLEEPDEWVEYSWVDSLHMCGQCLYTGTIPPSAIKVVEVENIVTPERIRVVS